MAADSFHHTVENGMKSKGKMYDFDDFTEIINSHGIAVVVEPLDFKEFRSEQSKGKDTAYPLLCNISQVCFKKNSTKMFWKESLTDTDYKCGEFLQKKFRIFLKSQRSINKRDGPRGLNADKQKDILAKLGKIIPADKLKFWEDMPIKDDSADLARNIQG